jgi:hypothetical protein
LNRHLNLPSKCYVNRFTLGVSITDGRKIFIFSTKNKKDKMNILASFVFFIFLIVQETKLRRCFAIVKSIMLINITEC